MSIGAVREPRMLPLPPPPLASPQASPQASPLDSPPEPSAPPSEAPSPFAGLLQSLGHEIQRGESLVRSAVEAAGAGLPIGPAELIALQAGVYRYGEAVDLASRLVDRTTTAVKTVLQAQ